MIVFPAPDLDAPGGGVRIIYAMAEALDRAGYPAAVWHGLEEYRSRWFTHDAPVVVGVERRLEAGDVVVVPELGGARHQHLFAEARTVMLNQRHFYTLFGADWRAPDPSPYPGWPNAVAAIATSQAIVDFLTALVPPDFGVHPLPLFVDEEMFVEERPKQREIAFMLNRRTDDIAAITALIRRHPELPPGWEFVGLEDRTSAEVAAALGRAAVFINLSDRDGFSLPGAEAMAAGCYVVGFHGDGAKEYMRPEFSTLVDDPDLVALADAVVAAARKFEEAPEELAGAGRAAREYVRAHYSRSDFDDRVVALFESLLADGSAAQPGPCTVRHYSWLGARPMKARARSAVGRLARRWSPTAAPVPQTPAPPDHESSTESGLSVVIPHWGDPALAAAAARDVLEQAVDVPVEVIVVDDASPEPFAEQAGVTVIRREHNGGFGAAVNTGVARARCPWLLILNSDIRLDQGFLSRFLLAAAAVQPAICSPQLVGAEGPQPTGNLFRAADARSQWTALAPLARLRESGRLDPWIGHDIGCVPGRRVRTEWLTGACLLLRREDFEAVGGFDERFHMFYEEVDLQRRLAERGVAAWFLGDLTVSHAGGGSTQTGTRVPGTLRSQYLYARKYGRGATLRAATTGVDLANLGYDTARDLAGKNVGAWSTFRRRRAERDRAWREAGERLHGRP